MNERLKNYLAQAYRRDVLGKPVRVEMPESDPELLAAAEAEIARIDGLHLGAHLASRDFVSYQNRRALVKLRDQLRLPEPPQEAAAMIRIYEEGPYGRKPT